MHRLSLVAGRFSLNDFFDNNAYAHDPRTQFLNWGFMDNLAWDYAADTRGYTWGFVLEYNTSALTARLALALEPKEANELLFDPNVAQAHGDNLEVEYRHAVLSGHPGRLRFLAYANHAHMGSYEQALAQSSGTPDIVATRDYRVKYGFGLNVEQELTRVLGAFARLGWNDGATESWAFTEVDRTVSLGLSVKGAAWARPADVAGLGAILSSLSSAHARYLGAGGVGFLLGDGALGYAPEQIIEAFYLFEPCRFVGASLDFQLLNHPGFNADRGPAEVFGGRLHFEL